MVDWLDPSEMPTESPGGAAKWVFGLVLLLLIAALLVIALVR
jgi:hypothetical protein